MLVDTEADDGSEKPQSCKGDGCNDENASDNDDFEEDGTYNISEHLFQNTDMGGTFV